jgi:hypothetical protein
MDYLFLTSVLLPVAGCAAIVAYIAVVDHHNTEE